MNKYLKNTLFGFLIIIIGIFIAYITNKLIYGFKGLLFTILTIIIICGFGILVFLVNLTNWLED